VICPNCDGRKCMDCVTRTLHPTCVDDCPSCCMRTFGTGATRDIEAGKLDYEGFLSPLVLRRYAKYMQAHQVQSDGKVRTGDNWQKGMPIDVYMKSMLRHVMDVWLRHDGHEPESGAELGEALCAVVFNAMGYLYELERNHA
jgi:hypothetical protein